MFVFNFVYNYKIIDFSCQYARSIVAEVGIKSECGTPYAICTHDTLFSNLSYFVRSAILLSEDNPLRNVNPIYPVKPAHLLCYTDIIKGNYMGSGDDNNGLIITLVVAVVITLIIALVFAGLLLLFIFVK